MVVSRCKEQGRVSLQVEPSPRYSSALESGLSLPRVQGFPNSRTPEKPAQVWENRKLPLGCVWGGSGLCCWERSFQWSPPLNAKAGARVRWGSKDPGAQIKISSRDWGRGHP